MDTTRLKDKDKLFEENRRLGGYNLLVVEDWGNKIKKRFITEKEKELYLNEFGEKMITDSEFYNWWKTINNL